ncbi:hypothetical protein NQZ68_032642 [Dissostichus eleginoides]|nr:hypothetical protein NQZ68_032642 [Dissostichus eleginoides]
MEDVTLSPPPAGPMLAHLADNAQQQYHSDSELEAHCGLCANDGFQFNVVSVFLPSPFLLQAVTEASMGLCLCVKLVLSSAHICSTAHPPACPTTHPLLPHLASTIPTFPALPFCSSSYTYMYI